MSGEIRFEVKDWVASVEISHPGKFNAMSRSMWRELKQVFDALTQRTDVRCVVIQGEAGHFCAGGDIAEYPTFRFDRAQLAHFHEAEVWGGLNAIRLCDLPVVAAIEGNCMGAGVEIASCCDIRLASETSRFGAPIARLGFPMAPREARLVAEAVGLATAREMLLEAAVLPASEMKARGFLNRLYPEGSVQDEAQACAARMVVLSPTAARLNKQTLRVLGEGSVPLDDMVASAYSYADHAEHREGIEAFLAKRKPVF